MKFGQHIAILYATEIKATTTIYIIMKGQQKRGKKQKTLPRAYEYGPKVTIPKSILTRKITLEFVDNMTAPGKPGLYFAAFRVEGNKMTTYDYGFASFDGANWSDLSREGIIATLIFWAPIPRAELLITNRATRRKSR